MTKEKTTGSSSDGRGRRRLIRARSDKRALASNASSSAEKKTASPGNKVMAVFVGLLAAQFVSSMSNTIIANAMPVIVAQIGGNAVQYTWIITAGILANTIVTPVAGKLADLFDKKKLFIFSMVLFATASLLSGAAQSASQLIVTRLLQGAGMGMMITLTMVIMATIVSPRERGKYNGYMAASMAVSTVAGPLIGGLIVDSPLGWRWCFWVTLPFVIGVMFIVARRLRVPTVHEGKAKIDFLGIAFIGAAAASLLIWISSEGRDFEISSPASIALLVTFVISTILFVVVESKVPEPLIPLYLFRNRTVVLAIVAFIGQGVAMFSISVFFGQYFQYGRGYSPTAAGLLTLPVVIPMMLASTIVGRRTTATGYWKRYVSTGMAAMVIGALLLVPVTGESSLWYLGISMAVFGTGMGAAGVLMVAVQNLVGLNIMGATTSTLMFFRTLAGALGIQLLGRVYQTHVRNDIVSELGEFPQSSSGAGELDIAALPDPVEAVVRTAYAQEIGAVFVWMAAIAAIGFVAVLFINGTSLRSSIDMEHVQKVFEQEDDVLEPRRPRGENQEVGSTAAAAGAGGAAAEATAAVVVEQGLEELRVEERAKRADETEAGEAETLGESPADDAESDASSQPR
ncbi:MDR family MFS transporter [Actinomycetaceae bacterium L2_0104]